MPRAPGNNVRRQRAGGRRAAVLCVAGVIALVASGCSLKFASAGARCSKIGDFAQDGSYVLKCNKKRRWERGISVGVADFLACAAFKINCPPAPPAPTVPPNRPPVITAFTSLRASGPTPFTTALIWNISDAPGQVLTCQVNFGDGSPVRTIPNCDNLDDVATTYLSPGAVTATLTVSDGSLQSSATATITPLTAATDPFNITIRVATQNPSVTSGQQAGLLAAVSSAVARWETVIRDGLSDVAVPVSGPGSIPADDCGIVGLESFSGVIDDLVIDVRVGLGTLSDGPGGVLAFAGSCRYRGSNGLSGFGILVVDGADIDQLNASGRLGGALLHEMGHVLGVGGSTGSNWAQLLVDVAPPADVRFAGAIASARWQQIGGSGYVPVETGGGSGTALGHWDERTFDTELMTGYSEFPGTPTPLSVITVGSLGDMGYGVDLNAADPYSLPPLALRDSASARSAIVEPTLDQPHRVIPNSPF